MNMLIELLIIAGGLFIGDVDCGLIDFNIDSYLNFTELSKKYGYTAVRHTVTTEDGYILTMYRMPMGKNCHKAEKKPPILLVHGLSVSSSIWLVAGPRAGLAYLLPDACYDLWCPATRGTEDSLNHVKYNWRTDAKYWNFTITDLATFDLPAVIDYILNNTNSKKLYYIGHSEGGSIFYMLGSERPEYLDKIAVSVTMAPSTWLYHAESKSLKIFVSEYKSIYAVAKILGINYLFAKNKPITNFIRLFCNSELIASTICKLAYELVDGKVYGTITARTLSTTFGHFPDATNLKVFGHFAQLVDDNFYRQYNYGEIGNLEVYGSSSPPDYKLSEIHTPICILYGKNDKIVASRDVQTLRDHLGDNVILHKQMDDEHWNHIDFALSKNTRQQLLPIIVECLNYKK